jgi:ribonuclease HII
LKKIDFQTFEPAPVIGVDEVGRGCLAGPVYAGAVCFRHDLQWEKISKKLTDSKLLSEKRRDELFPLIQEVSYFGLGSASVEEIDELNILQASLLAMKRAVIEVEKQMNQKAGHLLIDGTFKIPGIRRAQTTIIEGDLRVAPISAAAIFAKVHRDRLMKSLAETFPNYGFESHKGYACEFHRTAIKTHGVTHIHRKTFKGVKEFVRQGT